MTKIQLVIGTALLAASVSLVAVVSWDAERNVVRGGFWFHDVSFEMPLPIAGRFSPITEPERQTIESLAWSELRSAYAGLRITFVDSPHVRYSVRVLQRPPGNTRLGKYAAGESYSIGVLGGMGILNFEALASLALANAPPDADRITIIEGIGRGLGRAAAHEFAHQLLSGVNLHESPDRASYEYRTVDRVAQFYGPIYWDFAAPLLLQRLGSTN